MAHFHPPWRMGNCPHLIGVGRCVEGSNESRPFVKGAPVWRIRGDTMSKSSTERSQKPGLPGVAETPLAPQRWGESVGGRESSPGLGSEEQRTMSRTELAARYKNPVQWTEHPWVVRVEGYQTKHFVPLHKSYLMKGRQHYGIIVSPQYPIGETLRRMLNLLETLAAADTASLRVLAYAGSPMPVGAIRELRTRFADVQLHNFFGLTETIAMTHVLTGTDALEHPDSIGKLLPFVEAIIVDDAGAICLPDEVGELLFAREVVISGYYHHPEQLAEAIRVVDGREWFGTGDLAGVDAEGFFYLKGRKKEMIIVGGENVFATEIEALLLTHPQIREAAVIGVPATGVRKFLGELIHAFVVPTENEVTEVMIRKFCVERLAGYQVPHFVTLRDTLPLSNSI